MLTPRPTNVQTLSDVHCHDRFAAIERDRRAAVAAGPAHSWRTLGGWVLTVLALVLGRHG